MTDSSDTNKLSYMNTPKYKHSSETSLLSEAHQVYRALLIVVVVVIVVMLPAV
jgi:hypothetical protein